MKFFRRNWLYLLIATLPFERIPSWDVTVLGRSVTVRISYIILLVALAFLGWRLITKPKIDFKSPFTWLGLYMAVAFLSVLASLNLQKAVVAFIALALTVLAALLIAKFLKEFDLELIYKILLLVTVAICGFGLYQFIGDSLGLPTQWTGLRSIYVHSLFGFPRIQSTELEPLYLGNFLLIPIILLTARLLTGRDRSYYFPVLFLLVVTLVLTLSRGAFGAAAVGLAAAVLLLRRQIIGKRFLLTGLIGGLGVAAAFGLIAIPASFWRSVNQAPPPPLSQPTNTTQAFVAQAATLTSEPGKADNDRAVNRKLASEAFRTRYLIGYGVGNFGIYAERNDPTYAATAGKVTVNNQYFEVLAETGILGAIALIGFLIALAWAGVRAWKVATPQSRVWIGALGSIIIAFLVQYYAFSTLYILHIWVVIGLLLALTSPGFGVKKSHGHPAED